MPRLAFRRILPVVQLALFIAFMVLAHAEKKADDALWDAWRSAHSPATKIAADGEWDNVVHMWDEYIPASWQLAFAINLPAFLLAVPVALALNWLMQALSLRASWLSYVVLGAAVLAFWRFVGVWLDRRRHLLPPAPRRLPAAVLKGVAYVGGAALVALGLSVGVATFRRGPIFYPIAQAGMIFWPLVLGAILILEPRRLQSVARAPATSAGS